MVDGGMVGCYDFVAVSALDVVLIGFPANQACIK